MSHTAPPGPKSIHSSTASQKAKKSEKISDILGDIVSSLPVVKAKKSEKISDNLGDIVNALMAAPVLTPQALGPKDRGRPAAELSMEEAVRLKGVADKAVEAAKAALRKSGRETHGASKVAETKSKSNEQRKRGVSPKPAKETASKKVRATTDAVSHVRAESHVRTEKPTTAPGSLNKG